MHIYIQSHQVLNLIQYCKMARVLGVPIGRVPGGGQGMVVVGFRTGYSLFGNSYKHISASLSLRKILSQW